jgi:hypothetical protein
MQKLNENGDRFPTGRKFARSKRRFDKKPVWGEEWEETNAARRERLETGWQTVTYQMQSDKQCKRLVAVTGYSKEILQNWQWLDIRYKSIPSFPTEKVEL